MDDGCPKTATLRAWMHPSFGRNLNCSHHGASLLERAICRHHHATARVGRTSRGKRCLPGGRPEGLLAVRQTESAFCFRSSLGAYPAELLLEALELYGMVPQRKKNKIVRF